jgi:hypothetical protein
MKHLKVTVAALMLIVLIASATATSAQSTSGGPYGIMLFDTTSSMSTVR